MSAAQRKSRMTPLTEIDPGTKKQGLLPNEKPPRVPPTFSTGNYQMNWLSTSIIVVPILVVAAAVILGLPLDKRTFIVSAAFYVLNGMGITLGYHRFFAHRAFNGHWLVQWFAAIFGAGAFQGSIKWWSRNHRAHHRYIDTDRDPYNANRGFFYTHVGWMMMKQDYDIIGYVDIGDLHANRLVRLQHNNYLPFAMIGGIVLPTLICGLGWGDWMGGYCYAALAKMVFVHHCTFFINSLAHTDLFGAVRNFSEQHSSHDSVVCALLTFGEGYHNFHHEFANDYRNGIQWYHYDPTKWAIRILEALGLAKNLVRTPASVIARNVAHVHHAQNQRRADALSKRLDAFEKEHVTTEQWSWEKVEELCEKQNRKLCVVGNYVIDFEKAVPTGPGFTHPSKDVVLWYNAHPGGRRLLDMFVGKDATEAVAGGIHKHSEGALNLLKHLRVATIQRQ